MGLHLRESIVGKKLTQGGKVSDVELLSREELPRWFEYPTIFLSVVNQGLIDFHPWHMLNRERARTRLTSIRGRHPDVEVVPFAWRSDSDIIAGFERAHPESVLVFEDFQTSVHGKRYRTFAEWVHAAIDDMLSFEPPGSIWTKPETEKGPQS